MLALWRCERVLGNRKANPSLNQHIGNGLIRCQLQNGRPLQRMNATWERHRGSKTLKSWCAATGITQPVTCVVTTYQKLTYYPYIFSLWRSRSIPSLLSINSSYQLTVCVYVCVFVGESEGKSKRERDREYMRVWYRYRESAGGVWQAYLWRCDALTWKNASVSVTKIGKCKGASRLGEGRCWGQVPKWALQ